jgi:predicted nucleic acid-binding protein
MSYLLDTNIVSETIRKNPNRSVITWLDQIPGEALFKSILLYIPFCKAYSNCVFR